MGDRANVAIREGKEEVWLYTHWSGSELPAIVQSAMRRGKSRWDDAPYLARIIFCEMVKGDEGGETGFGIGSRPGDNEHDLIVVDVSKRAVEFYSYDGDHNPEGEPKRSFPFDKYVTTDLKKKIEA